MTALHNPECPPKRLLDAPDKAPAESSVYGHHLGLCSDMRSFAPGS